MPVGPAPPSLYGIQQRAGQSGQSASSGAGFDLDSALNDLLSRLQLPEPEPVKPAPLPAKILMGLGDILNARAAALLRQPAPESSLSQQTQREDQQRARSAQTAEGNRQVRNQVTTSLYGKKIEGEAQERRDKAVADRQAADDARAAEAARQKDEAEVREKTVKSWMDTLMLPGFVQWWKKVNPGVIDPSRDLTPDRIAKIQESFLRDIGMTPEQADTISKAQVVLSMAPSAQEAAPPGMELSGIQAGPFTYGKPKEDKADKDYLGGPLTAATARKAAGIGVDVVPDEAGTLKLIAEAERKADADKAKLAQQRLAQKTKGGNQVKQEIAVLKDVRDNAKLALDMLERHGDIGGPVAGRNLAVPATLAWDAITGSENYKHQIELDDALSATRAPVKKGYAGTAVSVGEFTDIHPMLPYSTDSYTKKVTNLKAIIKRADQGLANRKIDFGLTDEDMDSIPGAASVDSALPAGAIPLGRR